MAWHIDAGSFDAVRLDGLNIAMAIHSPGNMTVVPWKAAIYFDDIASESQKDALMKIYTGQASGHPARLVTHVGEVLGIRSLPMTYQAEGKMRSLRIKGVAEAEIEAFAGQGGADIRVENHPLAMAPGYEAVVSKSKQVTYQDYSLDWQFSGKNGYYSPFVYQGE